jgi:hypothetical protein
MAKKFSELRLSMRPESQLLSQLRSKKLLAAIPQNELRQARASSHKMLSDILGVPKSSITKLEKYTDMYLSTLRSHVQAMGGDLEIVARFPGGSINIISFSDLEVGIASNNLEGPQN